MNSLGINVKKILSLLLSAALIALSFSACSPYKVDAELTHLLEGNVYSLDPQTAVNESEFTVINAVFEGLCRIGEDGEALPGVANEWRQNADASVFEFTLRDDAKWSEGQPVTAEDFVFGIRRALDPATKATAIDELFIIKNAVAVNSGEASAESLGVYAKDEKTVVFELEHSYADFPALTASPRFMPCNEAFFHSTEGYYGLDCVYTLANGPFTFKTNYSWEKEKYIDLARTNNYRGEHSVAPAGVRMLMSDEEGYREEPLIALQNGDVEILGIAEESAAEMEGAGCKIQAIEDCLCGVIMNPTANVILDDGYSEVSLESEALRAVYMKSIDRQALMSRIPATLTEATCIMPPNITWGGERYVSFSYPEADQFLQNTIETTLAQLEIERIPSITVICPDDELSQSLANAVITAWNASLGNAFNIEPLPADEYESRIINGNYQAALYTLRSNGTLPLDVLKQFDSTASPRLLNNPDFDERLKLSMFDINILTSLENYIREACVFYPIYCDESYFAESPENEGILLLPDGSIDFSQTRKKDA